jgi:hypothetical protein
MVALIVFAELSDLGRTVRGMPPPGGLATADAAVDAAAGFL